MNSQQRTSITAEWDPRHLAKRVCCLSLLIASAWVCGAVAAGAGDADADGLPDNWESIYGLSSVNPVDGCLDTDGDGFLNHEEYIAGTNPTNASSKPLLLEIAQSGFGEVTIAFDAEAGFQHTLESSFVPQGPWTAEFASPIGEEGRFVFHVFDPDGQRYFRTRRDAGSDPAYSLNIVGYQNLTMRPGTNEVTHWFHTGADDLIDAVIPSAPDMTIVTREPEVSIFEEFFGWDPVVRLPPGQPFQLVNPLSSPFTLSLAGEVAALPTLLGALPDQTVAPGGHVTWRVEVEGSRPFSYQWKFNGTNLPGATCAVLWLTNVLPEQAGSYSVAVSNAAGGLIASAQLTVQTPVVLGGPVAEGGRIRFGVAGAAGRRYAIQSTADFNEWMYLITNTVPFTFTNGIAERGHSFFRAVLVE